MKTTGQANSFVKHLSSLVPLVSASLVASGGLLNHSKQVCLLSCFKLQTKQPSAVLLQNKKTRKAHYEMVSDGHRCVTVMQRFKFRASGSPNDCTSNLPRTERPRFLTCLSPPPSRYCHCLYCIRAHCTRHQCRN